MLQGGGMRSSIAVLFNPSAPAPRRLDGGLSFRDRYPSVSLRLLGLFVAFAVVLLSAEAIQAQTTQTRPTAFQYPGAADQSERAELRSQLREHAKILEAQSAVVKIVAKLVGPSVVHVEADIPPSYGMRYGRAQVIEEAGSGVIVKLKDKYYVLTNRHVVRNAAPSAIRVNLADGRRINPKKVMTDPDTDVAVLAVEAPELVATPIGDSDRVEIGDFVLAIGSPFGLTRSVTFGIISAKGRRDLRLGDATVRFQDFLQTDAAINPGNSGGPLANLRGEIIGINTAIASNSGGNEGIGFSIPINMFMNVAEQLIETGKVTRAFLGVNLNSKFGPATASELGLSRLVGAHISAITPKSPAEAAELKVGDVILEFDGTSVEDDSHLVNMVSLTEVGKKVKLLIFRDRKVFSVTVEVGDRGKFEE